MWRFVCQVFRRLPLPILKASLDQTPKCNRRDTEAAEEDAEKKLAINGALIDTD